MRIALVGVGSLGTIVGAYLSKSGEDIVLVDTNKAHVEVLNKDGATVTDRVQLNTPVKAITPDQMEGVYDLIIYLVKATFDDKAIPPILEHMDENSIFLTLQNGVPEEKIASFVGKERTLGCAVGFSATFIEPGVSALTSDFDTMFLTIGEPDGSMTPRIKKIRDILSSFTKVNISDNFIGTRWSKLWYNASASGMSVILDSAIGAAVGNPKAVRAVASIMTELVKTAHALDIKLTFMEIVDPNTFIDTIINDGEEPVLELAETICKFTADMVASMLQSLRIGQLCEVDGINGFLLKKAEEAGIDTPVNRQVVEIIRGIQDGRYPLGADNLDRLTLYPLKEIATC